MIRLTKLSFELKENVKGEIEEITSAYKEQVEAADSLGMPTPIKPTLDYNQDDFVESEHKYAINVSEISDVTVSTDGYTMIEKINGDTIAVKEDFETLITLITPKNVFMRLWCKLF